MFSLLVINVTSFIVIKKIYHFCKMNTPTIHFFYCIAAVIFYAEKLFCFTIKRQTNSMEGKRVQQGKHSIFQLFRAIAACPMPECPNAQKARISECPNARMPRYVRKPHKELFELAQCSTHSTRKNLGLTFFFIRNVSTFPNLFSSYQPNLSQGRKILLYYARNFSFTTGENNNLLAKILIDTLLPRVF